MTSKNSFFSPKLFWQKLGQYLWLTALWSIVIFFSLPVYQAFVLQRIAERNYSGDTLTDTVNGVFSFGNIWMLVFVMAAAVITALVTYHHMNSRAQTDFYNGQPVSRINRFITDFVSGFAMLGIPLVAGWLITMGMTALLAPRGSFMPGRALVVLLFLLLAYFIIYSFTIFAGVLCGNSVVAMLLTGTIFAYLPALFGGIMALCERFYETFYVSDGWGWLILKSSPASGLIAFAVKKSGDNPNIQIGGLWLLGVSLVALALLAFSLLLYRRRKSEAAGKALAFNTTKPIVKYGVTFVVTIFGGLLFDSIGGSVGWLIFGFLCGLILTTGIINVILTYDFKRFFQGWRALIAFSAAFALFILGVALDLTGYDKKLLTEDQVKAVAISYSELNNSIYSSWDETEYSDPENIRAALELAKLGVENLAEKQKDDAVTVNTEYSDYEYVVRSVNSSYDRLIVLKFIKKKGGNFVRMYRIPVDRAQPFIQTILNSKEYRYKALVRYLLEEDLTELGVVLAPLNDSLTMPASINGNVKIVNLAERQAVVEALKKDILENFSIDYASHHVPLFRVVLTNVRINSYYTDLSYPVYGNYANTLAAIERYDFNYEWQFDPQYVESMEVILYANEDEDLKNIYKDVYGQEISGYLKITDPEQIRQLLAVSYINSGVYDSYNFIKSEENCMLRIYFKGTDYSQHYSILKGMIPEFVKAQLASSK